MMVVLIVKALLAQTRYGFYITCSPVQRFLQFSIHQCMHRRLGTDGGNGSEQSGNIEQALTQWQMNIKKDQLTDLDRKIHKTHLKAVKVDLEMN